MKQEKDSIFPLEDALEIILFFDSRGVISYGNRTAREKLGYGEKLPGIPFFRTRFIRQMNVLQQKFPLEMRCIISLHTAKISPAFR